MSGVEIKECDDGKNCIVRQFINEGKSPLDVVDNKDLRDHVDSSHPELKVVFSTANLAYYAAVEVDRKIITNILDDMVEGIQEEYKITEKNKICCKKCEKYFDDDDNPKLILNCGHDYCKSCVLEYENCPECNYEIDASLKSVFNKKRKLENEDDLEECHICGSKINLNQKKGETILDCSCKFKLCLECASKVLTDRDEIIINTVDGISLQDTVKKIGACPQCRQVPKNKDEILMLWTFIPPTI